MPLSVRPLKLSCTREMSRASSTSEISLVSMRSMCRHVLIRACCAATCCIHCVAERSHQRAAQSTSAQLWPHKPRKHASHADRALIERRDQTRSGDGQGQLYSSSKLPAKMCISTAGARPPHDNPQAPLSANNLSAQTLEAQQWHWALARLSSTQAQRSSGQRQIDEHKMVVGCQVVSTNCSG